MTYRLIDVSAETPRALPEQTAPMLQWLPVADLVVDETYQRALNRTSWAAIRRIAAAFDWKYFGAVAVAPIAGGRFAIIDGQHRVHAAAICQIEAVPCIVSVLPLADQARAFAVINSAGIKVSPLQVYKAALASGEAWALACRDAVAAGGCQLMTFNGSVSAKKIGLIYSIGAIRPLVTQGRADVIRAALPPLRVHAEAMGPMSGPLLFRDDALRPWFGALAADRAFLDIDLAAFLARHRLMNLFENAARLRDTPEFHRTPLETLKRQALAARLRAFMEASQ